MKEEELIRELESVKLPDIEFESHQRRLKMALLNSGCFKKREEVNFMESVKTRTSGFRDIILTGLNTRYPVWKVALVSIIVLLVLAATCLSIPQVSGIIKSSLFPEGTRTISGPQLTADQQQQAMNILTADPGIREILAQGAVIDKILPVQVVAEQINPETGKTGMIKETWAQAWLVKGDRDWGVQIDLVSGKIISISP